MRTLVTILTLALIAPPAIAQNTAQSATAKESKQAAAASKDDKSAPKQTGQQAQAPTRDDTMTNYDVNGSNAADAMGATR